MDETNEEQFGRMGSTTPVSIIVFVEHEVPTEFYQRIKQFNEKRNQSIIWLKYKDVYDDRDLFKRFNVSDCPTILLIGSQNRAFSSPTVIMETSTDFEDIFTWTKKYPYFKTNHVIWL